mmetsp:Transcript_74801/g.150456  ORF Transcript_74801/g.150456 Transcript_74801/m.150456 type:complete len:314 (-) Transcript_74801:280-1221(-)|eukprot:CAMPEP_0171598792 /NCGR_PEP_ID=MMETSP0990-20121206/3335_1 /TAXON_ID=483369 /ORGANISM="non described non described, Strain CCMP2098" /LENGTH=313 /DNA_ID=CAMNT_0012160419 /DNA_START=248 /DNA_END=1189 /DNA_ORIENTATION=-
MDAFSYGGQNDPRGGGVMATADVFERPAIRDAQVMMERKAIPKQTYLDPWRENTVLYRSPVGPQSSGMPVGAAGQRSKPKVVHVNRRLDIPSAVDWLRHDDAPSTAMDGLSRERRLQMGDDPAGGANPLLGTLALNGNQGKAARISSQYYGSLTAGFSEEEKRLFLISGERRRRFAETKHAVTDTLGLGKPLPLSQFKGGYVPTGPKYKTAQPNPYPKLACDLPPPKTQQGQRMGTTQRQDAKVGEGFVDFDPWGAEAPWNNEGSGEKAQQNKSLVPPPSSLTVESEGDGANGPYDFDPWMTSRWGKTPKTSL